MTACRFVLNCVPTAQARTRHAVRGGHSVAYKSVGQKRAEAVLDDLLLARAPQKPLLRGDIGHTKKPDLDNLGKQLLDAMTRTGFWHDDKQVVSLHCSKRYAAVPGWEVAVYPVGGGIWAALMETTKGGHGTASPSSAGRSGRV